MNRHFFYFLLFSLLMSCVSQKTQNHDERKISGTEVWTIEKLALGSNIVMQTFDQSSNVCKISEDKIFSLPQRWKSVVDEQFEIAKEKFVKSSHIERQRFFSNECQKTCSCGTYSQFYDFLLQNTIVFSKREQKIVDEVSKRAETMSISGIHCLEKSEEFCKSDVLKEILRD